MCPGGKANQQHPGLHREECHQQVEGGDPSSSAQTWRDTPEVLGPVLASPVQVRHGLDRARTVKGHKDDKGTRASVI